MYIYVCVNVCTLFAHMKVVSEPHTELLTGCGLCYKTTMTNGAFALQLAMMEPTSFDYFFPLSISLLRHLPVALRDDTN